eukprot:CAMPEP_0167762256 /NCGR_PEP_ID=MMETSP0110_2-20121227/12659_1 /TAXON_ID=629695 /ORGANISM="Gymnochlora sp., Strain CCMP2014" /LENGTH=112 /DNA_ID=CAMNT_0007649095 /DNA_START=39 /DNA_END=374 /DNA_ORIENTATION=-
MEEKDASKILRRSIVSPALPGPATHIQTVYRHRSTMFFVSFWIIMFIMTNFIFFFFSFNNFDLNDSAWFVTVSVFVTALVFTYLAHTWYDWLAFALQPLPRQGMDDSEAKNT